jgi:hypothetical protein
MTRKPASISDCAKSLSYLGPLKDGGYISDADHDLIVGSVRRDLAKNGGVAGLEKEGRRKRMARGVAPDLSSPGGYNGKHPDNDPYGPRDEESLNWHQRAGYHGMYPVGGYDDPYASSPMGPDFVAGQQLAPAIGAVGSAIKQGVGDPLAQDVAASFPYPGKKLADTAAPLYRAIGRASKFTAPGRGLPGMFVNQPGGYRGGYDPELPVSAPGQQICWC